MRRGLLLTVTNSSVPKLLIKTTGFEWGIISKPAGNARPLSFLLKNKLRVLNNSDNDG